MGHNLDPARAAYAVVAPLEHRLDVLLARDAEAFRYKPTQRVATGQRTHAGGVLLKCDGHAPRDEPAQKIRGAAAGEQVDCRRERPSETVALGASALLKERWLVAKKAGCRARAKGAESGTDDVYFEPRRLALRG